MQISSISGTSGTNSVYSTYLANQKAKSASTEKPDPSKMLDTMVTNFMSDSDTDGDGVLSSSELSGLSSDSFKTLDTDSSGSLSEDEIKAAAQKQMEAMKSAFESNSQQSASSVKESLESTPEGELMSLMRPKGQDGPPPPPPDGNGNGMSQQMLNSYTQSSNLLSAYASGSSSSFQLSA